MSTTGHFIEVAIPVPMRQSFTYSIPQSMQSPQLKIGERVIVPFGPRQVIGIALSPVQHQLDSSIPEDKIKQLISRVSDKYSLPKTLLELLQRSASYYHHPIGDVIQQALPVLLRKLEQPNLTPELVYSITDDIDEQEAIGLLKRSAKQLALYQLIKQHPKLSWPELRTLSFSKAQLTALISKALVIEQPRELSSYQWHSDNINDSNKHQLSTEQAIVVSAIKQSLNTFKCHLVEGVTGSGKTEVYLQSIEDVLAQQQQVLILVPEIGLTPQTLTRFEQRFKVPIYLHHSGLNDTERLTTWLAAYNDQAAIILGTRSAIFSPLNHLGLIIVDEEHDGSFKQQDSFRYHARDLAILRARQLDIPIILGSATPSLESLHNALQGKYLHHQLNQRAGNSKPASLQLINVDGQHLECGLTAEVTSAIKHTLTQNEQVLVFLNRRGYAPELSCQTCLWHANCTRCNKSYTLHAQQQKLICHHCGDQQFIPKHCPNCNNSKLAGRGVGTEQLEQRLQTLFPQYSTVRIDRDSTRRKGELAKRLQEVNDKQHQILLGTQMLAKGHHFPNVTLVVILDVDAALFSFDFRATEHIAQLLTQVAGRSGRASKQGQVMIQTQHPEHPLLQDLVNNGYQHFARYTLTERAQTSLPPFSFQALIRAEANYPSYPEKFLTELAQHNYQDCWLAGPMPAALEKRAGKYRFHLLLQASTRAALHKGVHQLIQSTTDNAFLNKVRWSIDIDPQELAW